MDEKLSRAIDKRRDDLIALTQELIRFPTINPPGEAYAPCAEYIAQRLQKSGFETQLIRAEGTPGDTDRYPRTNVLARFDGRTPGQTVHFNSHIDVVDTGEGWTVDPFGGVVKDGKIYGRGACDMKGGLAASIIAAEAFLEVYPDFAGAIEISGTVDEESGGFGGVAYLASKGFFSKPRVDHVIIPEPLNKDRICLGHRGVWWAEIETKGEIAHGSMPFLGDCAVRHMGAVLDAFEKRTLSRPRPERNPDAGGSRGRAAIDDEYQLGSWRTNRRFFGAALAQCSRFMPAYNRSCASCLRRILTRSSARSHQSWTAFNGNGQSSITKFATLWKYSP